MRSKFPPPLIKLTTALFHPQERWTALLPDRVNSTTSSPLNHYYSQSRRRSPLIIKNGKLTESIYLHILQFLPIPDFPQFARVCQKFSRYVKSEKVWEFKLNWLDFKGPGEIIKQEEPPRITTTTTTILVESDDDEFGDFFDGTTADQQDNALLQDQDQDDGFGDFQQSGQEVLFTDTQPPLAKKKTTDDDLLLMFDDDDEDAVDEKPSRPPARTNLTFSTRPISALASSSSTSRPSAFAFDDTELPTTTTTSQDNDHSNLSIFKTYHSILLPYYLSLTNHTTSSLVFTNSQLSSMSRAKLLSTLTRFCLHELISPTRSLTKRLTVLRNVESAKDFFESTLVSEFERYDQQLQEQEQGSNSSSKKEDDDEGIIEKSMKDRALVLWELNQSNSLKEIFVQKREEVFFGGESLQFDPLDNLTKIETPSSGGGGDLHLQDGIDFSSMDHYMSFILTNLIRQGSLILRVFPKKTKVLYYFFEKLTNDIVSEYITNLLNKAQTCLQPPLFLLATAATFGQVYRLVDTVLEIQSQEEEEEEEDLELTKEEAEDVIFKMFEPLMDDYLLEEGEWIRKLLEGICQEWDQKTSGGNTTTSFLKSSNPSLIKKNVLAGFTKVLLLPVTIIPKTASYGLNAITYGATGAFNTFASLGGGGGGSTNPKTIVSTRVIETSNAWDDNNDDDNEAEVEVVTSHFDRMQLFLSLDVALQLIQADRDCLKRVETFIRYPGLYGRKVRDTIEEVFIVLLQVLGDKHVVPAFKNAIKQMDSYKPQHDEQEEVAPLVQFFELVHIGDTIQQMVDVYFEKEMLLYIDKKDFLNSVIREKKKFESSLDDAVASGLNAAVNILMNHIDYLLTSLQSPLDFCPPLTTSYDFISPTSTCSRVISDLKKHCDMLKGSTDKHILEVFNQEVGLRLHGILLKNLKQRLIVNTLGGLQLISDLNSYHQFVTSLKQPQVISYFSSLKLVGEIFIVSDPKDLGTLVRDTSRYQGTLSPDDLYELVQRRQDWKKIDKLVEKQLFGLKLADDCRIS
jgi:recyclin-1